jgi:hypothetical protein
MNEDVRKALEQLAEKLGVTVAQLWSILIHGNRVEGIYFSVILLFSIAVMYTGFRLFTHKGSDGYDSENWKIGGFITTCAGAVLALFSGYFATMGLFAPEYCALQDVLAAFKH